MKKRYVTLFTGLLLLFLMLTGCGVNRGTQTAEQSGESGNTQREEQLQAEIDALQQEIDSLKQSQQAGTSSDAAQPSDNSQTTDGAQSGGDTQTTDDSQTSANSQKTDNTASQSGNGQSGIHHSAGNAGSASNVALSLEEAQNIALARVPGATAQNIRIELDFDDGWYLYEGDILYNRVEYEFEIDANTGNVLKWEEERW